MPSHRVLRAVLHNFLGTYVSRYSAYRGYWLLGFLVASADPIGIDLVALPMVGGGTPIETARRLAIIRFSDQVRKAGMEGSIRRASLLIQRGDPRAIPTSVYTSPRMAFELRFTADAVACTGQSHRAEAVVVVAPHDPGFELPSGGRL